MKVTVSSALIASPNTAAGVGAQAGRNIHRQHRQVGGVGQADGLRKGLAHGTCQAGAEQCIHYYALEHGALAPGLHHDPGRQRGDMRLRRVAGKPLRRRDRQHPHSPTRTLRQRRDQVAVAGIVAVPGEHVSAAASGQRRRKARQAAWRRAA
ncbi:Uncharacterised protein [Pseudomonas aeruginosa]|nr:Uncharacterised protein [Pseudomonas aeruginosa]